MSTRYTVTTKSRLNGDGIWGAWMLVVSPVLQGLGWKWYLAVPEWWALAFIAITATTFFSGIVMLAVGRDYTSIVDQTSD